MYLLNSLRALFILASCLVGVGIQNAFREEVPQEAWFPALMAALAICLVAVEVVFQKQYLAGLVAVFVGLLLGLFATSIVTLLLRTFVPEDSYKRFIEPLGQMISLFLCYLSVTIVFQSKDRLRLVIPYVTFSHQGRKRGGLILDTSLLIDGRICELSQSSLLSDQVVVPSFVIGELQTLADSADALKRARGRRGLDVLAKLQGNRRLVMRLDETDFADLTQVDAKLLRLAKVLDGILFTCDHNLAKVGRVEGLEVALLQDLAAAVRPIVSPGDRLHVKVMRPGEERDQGVGFLEDGMMVVVEAASGFVGREVEVEVLRLLSTQAGRMVFARMTGSAAPRDAGRGGAPESASEPARASSAGGAAAKKT